MYLCSWSLLLRRVMKTSTLKRTLMVAALWLLSPVGSNASEDRTFLWKSEGPTNTVYVLGSIHMGSATLYPLDVKIERAFADSEVLVMEAETNPRSSGNHDKWFKMTYYTDERTIETDLSPDTFRRYTHALQKLNIPLENIDKVKPWQAAIILSTVNLQQSPIRPEFGIDYHFYAKAHGNKHIGYLETYDENFGVLAGMDEHHQDQFLNYTLVDLGNAEKQILAMLGAWRKGNEHTMRQLIFSGLEQYPELSEVLKIVYDNRNYRMAQRIGNLMWSDKNYFVIVGVGHLIGNNNVIEQLNSDGYELVRM